MKSTPLIALAISIAMLSGTGWEMTALAAKKYYPPGFTPPSDQTMAPGNGNAGTKVIVQPGKVIVQPGQVIVKTVPEKPRDPLTLLINERRYFEALRMVDARLKKKPADTSLQLLKGQLLRDSGSFEEAVSQYETVLERNKNRYVKASAMNGLGWTYFHRARQARNAGDKEGYETWKHSSQVAFQQALKVNPKLHYALAGLGQWELQAEPPQLVEARKFIRRAQQLAPNDVTVKLANADLMLAESKPQEALEVLYGLKTTASHNPDVYQLLARASLDLDRVDDAIIHLKQLLEIAPEHTEALRLLSTAYELKMQPEDARASLEKATALNPGDVQSVEALLKIYDQAYESERAILLLKTLLREKPGQRDYQLQLLSRLKQTGRWDELYDTALVYVDSALNAGGEGETPKADPALDELVSYFTQGAYARSKGMITERKGFLNQPIVLKAKAYSQARVAEENQLAQRLNLLMLNPFTPLPKLTADRISELQGEELDAALQMAFLQGDMGLYSALFQQWQEAHPQFVEMPHARQALELASDLYMLGDYAGATRILTEVKRDNAGMTPAANLLKQVQTADASAREQLVSLEMLPRKIPANYWEKTASEALKLGNANWKTHALLAERLESQDRYALAWMHQKLAARYAPDEKERSRWEKKAARMEKILKKHRDDTEG